MKDAFLKDFNRCYFSAGNVEMLDFQRITAFYQSDLKFASDVNLMGLEYIFIFEIPLRKLKKLINLFLCIC